MDIIQGVIQITKNNWVFHLIKSNFAATNLQNSKKSDRPQKMNNNDKLY